MEILNNAYEWIQIAVMASGVAAIVIGFEDYSAGKGQHNAGKKDEGMGKMIGGIVIVALGYFFVPELLQSLISG